MKNGYLRPCAQLCLDKGISCPIEDCKYWIEYEKECNCSLVSIYINGDMTLQQVGERLDLSFVRISQIEKKAVKRLKLLCKS